MSILMGDSSTHKSEEKMKVLIVRPSPNKMNLNTYNL